MTVQLLLCCDSCSTAVVYGIPLQCTSTCFLVQVYDSGDSWIDMDWGTQVKNDIILISHAHSIFQMLVRLSIILQDMMHMVIAEPLNQLSDGSDIPKL